MGVKLDGIDPKKEWGLIFLRDHYHPATPEMRNRTMTIPGMPGEWDFGSEWGSRPFSLPFGLIDYDRYELQRKLRAFVAFLMDAYGKPRELKLSFDYEPDKYYSVKVNGRVDVDRAIFSGQLDLPLIAHKPFAYAELNAYDSAQTYLYNVGFKEVYSTTTDFTGKISGSTVENPHIYGRRTNTGLGDPTVAANWYEPPDVDYNQISQLDGDADSTLVTTNNVISQHKFSFNLIEAVESKYGEIPAADTEGKVQWLKNNLSKITANWWGKGSGPTGNKATFRLWNKGGWDPLLIQTTTNAAISKLTIINHSGHTATLLANSVDPNGFVHFLAYAEASDGVSPSRIDTDFIELIVELKTPWLERDETVEPEFYYDSRLYFDNVNDFIWTETKHYSGLYNYSSLATPLIVEIEGSVINPRITNTLSGETMHLPTITNQKMVVNTSDFTIKVDDKDAFIDSDFILLEPGENSLLFEGGSPNATVKFKWKHRFI